MTSGRARANIQAGDMRKPLHVMVRNDVQDAAGGETTTYTDLFGAAVWAQDEHKSARQVNEAGKLVTATYHKYTVYYNIKITAGLYLVDPDFANPMYIQGVVDPDGARHYMELTAEDIEG